MNQPTFYSISRNVFISYPDQPYLPHACDPAKLGVLTEYIGPTHKYDLDQINQIIADLLRRQPYMAGAEAIDITVMWEDGHHTYPLHCLRFLNPECENQAPGTVIRYTV